MDLTTIIPPAIKPDVAVEGRIANTPEHAASDLFVIIDSYDPHQRFGPCYFMPKGGELPARDDPCLVVFDELRQPWVAVWWNGSVAEGGGDFVGDSVTVTGAVTSGSLVTGPLTATTGLFTGIVTGSYFQHTSGTAAFVARNMGNIFTIPFATKVSGDANDRFDIYANGTLTWGDGTAAFDTNLYRYSANILQTDSHFRGGASIRATPSDTTTSLSFISYNAGLDSWHRFGVTGAGKILLGDGTIQPDVNLYRSAADTLKTDDSLIVTGTLSSGAQALTSATLSGTGKTTLSFSDTSTTTGFTIGGDTNLYRLAAGTLATDGTFTLAGAGNPIRFTADGQYIVANQSVNATSQFLYLRAASDSQYRFNIDYAGKLAWGSGSAPTDTNLYRSAADTLKTDDALNVNGTLTSGISVAPRYAAGPADNAGANIAYSLSGTGDSIIRWQVNSDGKLWLGSGSATVDTNLYRSAADTLKTDDALTVTGIVTSASYFNATGGSAALVARSMGAIGSIPFATKVTGDANDRFDIYANGTLTWGDGTASFDTNLYRAAANVLRTADQFVADDGVTTKPVAGVVSDASFTATPASGTLAVDTTNSFLYVRVGSTWKKVAVA